MVIHAGRYGRAAVALVFPGEIRGETGAGIRDRGLLARQELRDLLALADVVVRPAIRAD
ncbi:MAG: hypothetical protein ACREBC_11685 [Pyrinomonadaceae bacterium]